MQRNLKTTTNNPLRKKRGNKTPQKLEDLISGTFYIRYGLGLKLWYHRENSEGAENNLIHHSVPLGAGISGFYGTSGTCCTQTPHTVGWVTHSIITSCLSLKGCGCKCNFTTLKARLSQPCTVLQPMRNRSLFHCTETN